MRKPQIRLILFRPRKRLRKRQVNVELAEDQRDKHESEPLRNESAGAYRGAASKRLPAGTHVQLPVVDESRRVEPVHVWTKDGIVGVQLAARADEQVATSHDLIPDARIFGDVAHRGRRHGNAEHLEPQAVQARACRLEVLGVERLVGAEG